MINWYQLLQIEPECRDRRLIESRLRRITGADAHTVQAAREILLDPHRRTLYDGHLQAWETIRRTRAKLGLARAPHAQRTRAASLTLARHRQDRDERQADWGLALTAIAGLLILISSVFRQPAASELSTETVGNPVDVTSARGPGGSTQTIPQRDGEKIARPDEGPHQHIPGT
jgi:curved DNA-binding protein CbpA